MKTVEIPEIIICSVDDPRQSVKSKEADSIYRNNVKNIVLAAAHVENRLASGVGKYFFGDDLNKHLEFDNMILSSDSFTFSAKRKAFLHIIKTQKILSGSQLNDFEKLIARVIRYRNMFTHGTPVYHGAKCILHYFESSKRELELSDDFLEKVEKQVTDCIFQSENLVQKIKVINT